MHPPLTPHKHPHCAEVGWLPSSRGTWVRGLRFSPHIPQAPAVARLFPQKINALVQCHEATWYNKFIGSCNDQKTALDACFREEVLPLETPRLRERA